MTRSNLRLSTCIAVMLLSPALASLCLAGVGSVGIAIVKSTNGTDNDGPPGPEVPVGSTVTFTYVVTNTGNNPLSGVTVSDDNGTPGNLADDFNAAFVGGDTNGNGLLDVAETFNFSASRIATVGQYVNVGSVGALAFGEVSVAANDPDHHFGVAATSTPTGTPTSTATSTPTNTDRTPTATLPLPPTPRPPHPPRPAARRSWRRRSSRQPSRLSAAAERRCSSCCCSQSR